MVQINDWMALPLIDYTTTKEKEKKRDGIFMFRIDGIFMFRIQCKRWHFYV